ncbi:TetR/AcrR family transcriptional regulator [Pseudonocardia humida]|uniref:TetR/AcrR family transcriptional regulator n=1 Tax=Pseudonocardia humida TaxID=2800819 RepID=A0ABT1AD24_9PSEU|nr:TetR/AcrR family transcriptional regulator [Pseudonocardia humida]MCO1660659.1 TetR/AcrR family transcriptional regulator [Pseudonocardia humida]
MPEIRRRSDAVRNRARIVAAAVSAFDEVGPQLRLDDLAERAGVGVATVYRLFGSRDGLVQAAFETVFGAEIEPLAQAAREAPDPATGLRDVLGATLERVAAHRGLFRAARETGAVGVDIAERYLRDLDDVLRAAQRAGAVRTDVALRDVAAVLVMVLAVVRDGDPDGADRRRYLSLLLDGLRPGAPALPPPAPGGWEPPVPPPRGECSPVG